ncbi:MAG: DUF4390 domain-containing protein [Burkholderiales bacterium]|jgi:hypothetical protein|nr:DUF4390 domain-containing protein [Burkholderiales bacterium]
MWFAALVFAWLALWLPMQARAEVPEFTEFEIVRNDEGVSLSFALRFDLPRGVEDALSKGVPLYFVAEIEVFRDRWYWRDKRITKASRVWRVAYQPLTRKYRVSFGGLNQNFDSLNDALVNVRRVSGWKIAEKDQIDDGRHYVEFTYRLDTTLLPRPMQIGIGGQPEWTLLVEKTQRFH